MKLLRVIRFDPSDTFVFDPAAEPGEWAVPGSFSFAGSDAAGLSGKARQAFANGFLGLSSFGRATFVTVSEASEIDLEAAARALAQHFVDNYGAPNAAAAMPQAHAELDFACDLCADAMVNTIFTLRRRVDDTGNILEEFRIVEPPLEPAHARVWDVSETDD